MAIFLAGCSPSVMQPSSHGSPIAAARELPPVARAFHLHLPGIGGKLRMDRYMIQGLEAAHLDAEIDVYDWTRHDPGINALFARVRNDEESKEVAKIISEKFHEDPRRRITITAHSGGAGLAVWALEKLPDDVKIDELVFLAPALSPQYDLTAAMKHVRGKVYSFNSEHDVAVLGMGTKIFGTIDGVRTEAAGKVGFTRPAAGDAREYQKLVQVPYEAAWMRFGNIGDHIGPMSSRFARDVIAPLLARGEMPTTRAAEVPGE